jgi:4-diphosphocytidyl-2C-methyl-D-erythritol kinase
VGIVCQSHSASLGLKHFAMPKHCPNVAATFESANLVTNCILDNARIRWLVNQKQQQQYGKVNGASGSGSVLQQQQQQQRQQQQKQQQQQQEQQRPWQALP